MLIRKFELIMFQIHKLAPRIGQAHWWWLGREDRDLLVILGLMDAVKQECLFQHSFATQPFCMRLTDIMPNRYSYLNAFTSRASLEAISSSIRISMKCYGAGKPEYQLRQDDVKTCARCMTVHDSIKQCTSCRSVLKHQTVQEHIP